MSNRFAERCLAALALPALVLAVAGCGGGNSTVTTITGGGTGASTLSVDAPTGPNTTEIVVDAGPPLGFSFGAANIPYVTVTVCTPGSTTSCVTIDHVFLDTGSIGLRLFKSQVAGLGLPPILAPADAASVPPTPAGRALECYQFVLGAVWGPLASADLRVGGEFAPSLPVQLIDDSATMSDPAPQDCINAANGGLQNSVSSLQANGILGVGMLAYDCGLVCGTGDYTGGYTIYYSCAGAPGTACSPAAIPSALQTQNPVVHFVANSDGSKDDNGTLITLPALPDLGAAVAKGRLVFGIGTQANNQLPLTATMYFVDANPADIGYLYFTTTTSAATYPDSYIDSGSNALFFDDASIAMGCKITTGSSGAWYCPPSVLRLTATLTGAASNGIPGASGPVAYAVANTDVLFGTSSSAAFADLAGSAGQGANAFVWGLPFFYGRTVFTSIWNQRLSPNGPWNAF